MDAQDAVAVFYTNGRLVVHENPPCGPVASVPASGRIGGVLCQN